ncbi:MAG: hypothetical protein OCC46_05465 [Pseudodesulfovibrio sp.]
MSEDFVYDVATTDTGEPALEVTCKCGEVIWEMHTSTISDTRRRSSMTCQDCGQATSATYNRDAKGIWWVEAQE